jgi:hypothetical protein
MVECLARLLLGLPPPREMRHAMEDPVGEATDLAGAARLLERAEALSKKVARIARTRTADAYPEHVPLGGFDFSPL